MDRKFLTIYNKFVTAHRARNHNEMIEIMVAYNCETITQNQLQHLVYMFRAAYECLRLNANKIATKIVAKIVSQFKLILSAAAKYQKFQQFLTTLNVLAAPEYLNANPSILASAAAETDTNMEHWMRTIGGLVVTASDGVSTADDRKAVFLALTQSSLIFFKLENELNGTSFNETKHFLGGCMTLQYLRSDKYSGDYVQCFKLFENYVNAWTNDASDWQKIMDEIISFVVAAPKSLRSTAVQDIAVTLAEYIQISKQQLLSMLNAERIRTLFKLILKLMDILRHTKYDKAFCAQCKGNVGPHEMDVVASVAADVYTSAIEKNIVLDAQICGAFGKIFAANLSILSKLNCTLANAIKQKQLQVIRQMVTLCKTQDKVKYAVPMFANIFQNFDDIQLTIVNTSPAGTGNEVYILRKFFDILKMGESWRESIHVGFFILAYALLEQNKNMLHGTMYEVSKIQLEHKDTIPFETPYDYYVTLAKGRDPILRMKFPENVSVVEMLLTYVKINGLYGTHGLDEFNNKCVYQLMMLASKQEPIRCMSFIYHIDKFNWDAVAERCERQLKILRASTDSPSETRAVSLLVGAFDFNLYLNRIEETTKKNNGIILNDVFNCMDQTTVFSEQTLAFEREQAQLLVNAKNRLESFLTFYLDLNETDRLTYEDESKYLLKALRKIARSFLCRDYERETLETYVSLYRLTKVVGDQFGMIDACSYFAEHSVTFRKRIQHQHRLELSIMLDQCYVHLVENIQNITALSIRKQKEIFYCMLNIALYHFADNRIDDGKKIMQFVKMQMKERNIQHGVVEMKYFSVLFTMITKYQQPSRFSAIEFGEYLTRKIRNSMPNLSPEDSINIPLMIFTAIPAIVTFCLSRYETSCAINEMLLLTVLKFSIRSGFVRRSLNTLILIGTYDLYQEKWQMSEKRLQFLEQMCQIGKNSESSLLPDTTLKIDSTVNTIDCTDPIRRDASISVRSLSPYKVITNNVESHMCRYLQTSHMKNCSCDICISAYNRFVLLQIGSLYTRTIYLNETNAQTKRSIQSEIYDYWSKHFKTTEPIESSENFLIGQARMLMWCAHVQWKFAKNHQQAEIMLNESIECLKKVEKYDCAMEHDLLGQIKLLNDEMVMANLRSGSIKIPPLNQKKSFIDKELPKEIPKNQPIAAAKKVNRPFLNIFEDTLPEIRPKPVKFQIHDDDSPEMVDSKKPTKKKTNNPKVPSQKVIKNAEESIVDLTTPPTSKTEISVVIESPESVIQKPTIKPCTRPNQRKCGAKLNNDEGILVQPTKITRRRADKTDVENTPVPRAMRPRRERK